MKTKQKGINNKKTSQVLTKHNNSNFDILKNSKNEKPKKSNFDKV